MPIPPFDLVWDKLISIVLPGFMVSAIIGLLLLRWKLAGAVVLAGFMASNIRDSILPWMASDQELGHIVPILICLVVLMFFNFKDTLEHRLAGAVWVGFLSSGLFLHDYTQLSITCAAVAVSIVLYVALSVGERRLPPSNLTGLLSLTGLATAIVMIHAHTARLSDIGLMWMASCGGLFLVTLKMKGELRGLASLTALLYPYLLFYGQQNTESLLPWVSFALIVLAPMSCLLALLNVQMKKSWLVSIVWVTLLVLAVGLAMRYETVTLE